MVRNARRRVVIPETHTSTGQHIKEAIVMFIIGIVVCAVIGWLIGLVYLPFMSVSMGLLYVYRKWVPRIKAREERIKVFRANVTELPASYDAWEQGEIPDPDLRWAPDVYIEELEKYLNPAFVDYLAIQYQLNMGDPKILLATIARYYPEFTPTMDGLREDIRLARIETEAAKLHAALVRKLQLDVFPDTPEWAIDAFLDTKPDLSNLEPHIRTFRETGWPPGAKEVLERIKEGTYYED